MGPETSVIATAEIVGVRGQLDPTLASLDVGRWHGLAPEDVAADLPSWFADPDASPHGGETVSAFVTRIHAVLADAVCGETLIVAAPVAQALLCESASRYFEVDVRPASVLSVAPRRSR